MPSISCIKEIEQRYNRLTSNEKKVSDYIAANPDKVVDLSISDLAKVTGVSKASIARLAKSLGFSGYPQLKIALAKDIVGIDSGYTSFIDPNDDSKIILNKVFNANIKTLENTLRQIDVNIFREMVDAISGARIVYINGTGASGDYARDFQRRLMQIGIISISYTDSAAQRQSTLNMGPEDFVLGISQSGRTMSIVDSIRLAKEFGVKTGCITGYYDSPIVEYSDLPLVVTTNSLKYPIDSISARVAQVSVFDSLIIALSNKKYDQNVGRIKQTNKFVEELRYKKDQK